MIENPKKEYLIKTEQYDVDYDEYMNFEKSFGEFNSSGDEYTVTDKDTPRQWLNFMVNDKFASVAANDGSGFTALCGFYLRVTRFYCATDYLVRKLDGKRRIELKSQDGKIMNLFEDSSDLLFKVRPGSVTYTGTVGEVAFRIDIFVPTNDSCEVWKISLKNTGETQKYTISAGEDIALFNMTLKDKEALPDKNIKLGKSNGLLTALSVNNKQFSNICAFFGMKGGEIFTEKYTEPSGDGREFVYTKADIKKEIVLKHDVEVCEIIVSGASLDIDECGKMYNKYTDCEAVRYAIEEVNDSWRSRIEKNYCEIPDKNLQNFLNIWLKNQVYLTMRYNRFDIMGFRDLIQDIWGHLLVETDGLRERIINAVSQMRSDGRCPKKFDLYSNITDEHDFMDGPLWIPILLSGYIKETGDSSIIYEKIKYSDSGEITDIKEHIMRSLDYLYNSRGKNGLILMRRGDWLDGLEGMNEFGETTTVWGTMAAFHACNIMAELLSRINDVENAGLMKNRAAEYKRIVNEVAWDGNWFAYAFIDNDEKNIHDTVGTHKLPEGKIYLLPQAWALMTKIVDSDIKTEKIYRSISNYLMSMYGPHMMAPPYTKYGERHGRLKKQRPGTFANSAVYLHAASFLAMADCVQGKFNDALDRIQRILPNHEDSCDSRRTSEPYAVGNVYYGVTHPCHGLNLYTWFTATPAWLIHCGFENLLGVVPEYDGLRIEPHDIEGWNEYKVIKEFRGTKYTIHFRRGDEKGIWLDDERAGNIINSDKKAALVEVVY